MNGRERYQATLRGEAVDHLARVPILMQFAAEHIGSHYGSFAADHRVLVEANLRCAQDFGIDQLSAISDPYRETQGFGGVIEFVPDGVPRCLEPPLAHSRDLRKLPEPGPLTSERMRDRVDAISVFAAGADRQHSIMGWIEGPAAGAADLRGMTLFMMDLVDDPRFAGALMDRCVDVGIEFARAQIAAGADTVGVGDAAASQVSGAVYRELIWPRQHRLLSALGGMGAVVRLHICGDITHLLDSLAELPVQILDVDHMVDLSAVRRIMGGRVTLAGNVDPVAGVRFSTPGAIRRAVVEAYRAVGNPFMVNAGCEIPSGTPSENLLALCEPVPYIS
jgi:MtaA/CmuA family methyltransferase